MVLGRGAAIAVATNAKTEKIAEEPMK